MPPARSLPARGAEIRQDVGALDHFFRHEAGRILALLTKVFGMRNLELAEDMVQETLLEAFTRWSFGSIPENPSAWVMTVAKRKVLNRLKRDRFLEAHAEAIAYEIESPEEIDSVFQEAQVGDSMLRMMFACCHPILPPESRVVLALKILCGFSPKEIASALLSKEDAVEKRLQRAKQEFRRRNLPLEIPAGESMASRFRSVHTCIYLLFNEGYNSSHPEFLIRKDLCMEAMRLCRLVIDHYPEHRPTLALMGLMCFHAARFGSRIDDRGALVIFQRQDRSLWNRDLIAQGQHFLGEASQGEELSEFHLEAAIAAEHCSAADFESTRWEAIDRYYAALSVMKDNPIIELNRAVILSRISGPEAAIRKLLALKSDFRLENYYLLHATLGDHYLQIGETDIAREYLSRAAGMTTSKTEIDFLKGKMERS
ncbi:MAG: sigma-70 family RNA polymerase sigma factor [Fibrobacteria bacterium]